MNPRILVFAFFVLGCGDIAAQDKRANPGTKGEEAIVRIQKILAAPLADTKGLQEELPLAKFLAAVEARLPPGRKVSLRIDQEVFGKQLPQVADAKVKLPLLKNVSLATVLRRALLQVDQVEVDYGIRPTGVVITRPQLTAHWMVYDVRDLVQQMPLLLPDWKKQFAELDLNLQPTDGPASLVRILMNGMDMPPWEAIQVLNGGRLAVLASPTRHQEVVDMLAVLRRMSDVAVVMNARLYEVDRAFFTRHVAPLFSADKDPEERPVVIPIDGPLLKIITQQKCLLESEDRKLRPHQVAPFLSQQSVVRFAVGPHPTKKAQTRTGTALAGASFDVRPLVSPDRRYLRLQICQKVVQLVGIDKVKTLDVSTGKEVEVETPNLRKTSVTGTIQIPDGNPILMPVAYRPPGKESEDKRWLLVARPFIWIEEEVKEIRKGGGDVSPQSIWDSEVAKEEKPTPAGLPR
jgi:hypothetical protein